MKIAVVMFGNKRHKNNEFGYWSIYAALKSKHDDADLVRLSVKEEEIKGFIQECDRYQLIFLSVYYDNYPESKQMIEKIKEVNPDCILCTGGYIYTYQGYINKYAYEKLLLDVPGIDFVIHGEPETASVDIADTVKNKGDYRNISGIAYRENQKIAYNRATENKCLDTYASAAKIQADYYQGVDQTKRIYLLGSRGCSSNCSFCFNHSLFDSSMRMHSVDRIVDDLKWCSDRGFQYFYFIDSSLDEGGMPNRLEQLADQILEQKLNIYFTANFKVNAHQLEDHVLIKLKQAGLSSVFIGCESFVDADLRLYAKGHTAQDNREAIAKFKNLGIGVNVGLIHYHPYSTIEGLLENSRALCTLGLDGSFPYTRKLRLFPGTRLHEKAKRDGLLQDDQNNYSYKDQRVAKIAAFLDSFSVSEIHDRIEDINYYYRGFADILHSERLKASRCANERRLEQTLQIEEEKNQINAVYGKKYHEWFTGLVSGYQGFDMQKEQENRERLVQDFDRQIRAFRKLKQRLAADT